MNMYLHIMALLLLFQRLLAALLWVPFSATPDDPEEFMPRADSLLWLNFLDEVDFTVSLPSECNIEDFDPPWVGVICSSAGIKKFTIDTVSGEKSQGAFMVLPSIRDLYWTIHMDVPTTSRTNGGHVITVGEAQDVQIWVSRGEDDEYSISTVTEPATELNKLVSESVRFTGQSPKLAIRPTSGLLPLSPPRFDNEKQLWRLTLLPSIAGKHILHITNDLFGSSSVEHDTYNITVAPETTPGFLRPETDASKAAAAPLDAPLVHACASEYGCTGYLLRPSEGVFTHVMHTFADAHQLAPYYIPQWMVRVGAGGEQPLEVADLAMTSVIVGLVDASGEAFVYIPPTYARTLLERLNYPAAAVNQELLSTIKLPGELDDTTPRYFSVGHASRVHPGSRGLPNPPVTNAMFDPMAMSTTRAQQAEGASVVFVRDDGTLLEVTTAQIAYLSYLQAVSPGTPFPEDEEWDKAGLHMLEYNVLNSAAAAAVPAGATGEVSFYYHAPAPNALSVAGVRWAQGAESGCLVVSINHVPRPLLYHEMNWQAPTYTLLESTAASDDFCTFVPSGQPLLHAHPLGASSTQMLIYGTSTASGPVLYRTPVIAPHTMHAPLPLAQQSPPTNSPVVSVVTTLEGAAVAMTEDLRLYFVVADGSAVELTTPVYAGQWGLVFPDAWGQSLGYFWSYNHTTGLNISPAVYGEGYFMLDILGLLSFTELHPDLEHCVVDTLVPHLPMTGLETQMDIENSLLFSVQSSRQVTDSVVNKTFLPEVQFAAEVHQLGAEAAAGMTIHQQFDKSYLIKTPTTQFELPPNTTNELITRILGMPTSFSLQEARQLLPESGTFETISVGGWRLFHMNHGDMKSGERVVGLGSDDLTINHAHRSATLSLTNQLKPSCYIDTDVIYSRGVAATFQPLVMLASRGAAQALRQAGLWSSFDENTMPFNNSFATPMAVDLAFAAAGSGIDALPLAPPPVSVKVDSVFISSDIGRSDYELAVHATVATACHASRMLVPRNRSFIPQDCPDYAPPGTLGPNSPAGQYFYRSPPRGAITRERDPTLNIGADDTLTYPFARVGCPLGRVHINDLKNYPIHFDVIEGDQVILEDIEVGLYELQGRTDLISSLTERQACARRHLTLDELGSGDPWARLKPFLDVDCSVSLDPPGAPLRDIPYERFYGRSNSDLPRNALTGNTSTLGRTYVFRANAGGAAPTVCPLYTEFALDIYGASFNSIYYMLLLCAFIVVLVLGISFTWVRVNRGLTKLV